MLQLTYLRDNKEEIIESLKKRNLNATETVNEIITLDDQRKKVKGDLDEINAQSNQIAKEIGSLYKEGKQEEANEKKKLTAELKEKGAQLKITLTEITDKQTELLYQIPNVPNPKVPKGNTEDDNIIIHEEGEIPTLHKGHQCHWDLAAKYNLIDFENGVKITGAGFPIYKGKGAKLQRALINFFLNEADKAGYEEFIPPLMVNEESGYGTGQLPDKEGQMYHVTEDDLYLIPTAEVPLTNILRNEILKPEDFPVKMCGYTPCFRREAGSYGKNVRGLNRLHQFDKVEIVQATFPENSYNTLDHMVEHVKGLLNKLGLPFRVALLCGGDLGFTSAITYDMEVYSAAQEKWLEVSSISNFETFQANRLKLRFKNKEGKTELAHTLNGSALALPRIVAALLENNQTESGIKIPEVLVPYTGFDLIS